MLRRRARNRPYNLLKHLQRYRNFAIKRDIVSMVRTLSPILIGVSTEEMVGQPRPVIAPVLFLIHCSGAPRWL
jgi:hypothetical protein